MRRYWKLLRRRDYALPWGGATVSALGDGSLGRIGQAQAVVDRSG
jgi:hypothetical protein